MQITIYFLQNYSMSAINTILLVVVLLILVGGGVWWYEKYGPGAQQTQTSGIEVQVGSTNSGQ